MSKGAVVTTRDSVGAFEALGFAGRVVEDANQAFEAIQSIIRSGGYGLVLVTSDVADVWARSPSALRQALPVVLVVPVTSSASDTASIAVRRLIENAVGIDLVGKMTEEKNHDTR